MSQEVISTSLDGAVEVCKAIQLLSMTSKQKQRFIYYLGKEIAKQARHNQREQKDVDGSSWAPRKKNRRRKSKSGKTIGTGKMMKNLTKSSHMAVFSNPERGVVTWKNALEAWIANQQQEGLTQKGHAPKGTKGYVNNNPATDEQAKALIAEGFTRKSKKGRTVRVSRKWIRENMTISHAGFKLRKMRGAAKKSWNIPLVARSFLGCDETLQRQMANTILKQMTERAKAGK